LREAKDGISTFGVNLPDNKDYLPNVKLNIFEEKKAKIKNKIYF